MYNKRLETVLGFGHFKEIDDNMKELVSTSEEPDSEIMKRRFMYYCMHFSEFRNKHGLSPLNKLVSLQQAYKTGAPISSLVAIIKPKDFLKTIELGEWIINHYAHDIRSAPCFDHDFFFSSELTDFLRKRSECKEPERSMIIRFLKLIYPKLRLVDRNVYLDCIPCYVNRLLYGEFGKVLPVWDYASLVAVYKSSQGIIGSDLQQQFPFEGKRSTPSQWPTNLDILASRVDRLTEDIEGIKEEIRRLLPKSTDLVD